MDLNEIRVFLKVVQVGSFSLAAKQLGIPASTTSAKVSSLEKRLGVTLLQRTTRKLNLTETGERYYRQCLEGLEVILHADAQVSEAQNEVQGLLRITAPLDMGNNCLVDLITRFNKRYPKARLEFNFSDRFVDLVEDGIDVAIRAGNLSDSALIAKKLGVALWAPFASSAYLKRKGTPLHPKDLRNHQCSQFTPFGSGGWQLSNAKTTVTVSPLPHQFMGNDINLVKALCLAGAGVALLPTYICHREVALGKLVRVLPEWRASIDPIHLVYPAQKFVAPKLRAFLDLAVEVFKGILKE